MKVKKIIYAVLIAVSYTHLSMYNQIEDSAKVINVD